jgi:hypothetical protein
LPASSTLAWIDKEILIITAQLDKTRFLANAVRESGAFCKKWRDNNSESFGGFPMLKRIAWSHT